MEIILVTILLISLASGSARPLDSDQGVMEESPVHNEYFAKIKEHAKSVKSCPHYANGIPYAIPKRPDCSPIELEKETITEVTVTTYWADFKIRPIEAVECFTQQQDHRVFKNMWNEPRHEKSNLYYEKPFLNSECRSLRQNQRTKEGKPLEYISSGLYGTKENTIPEPSYWGDRTETISNTFLYNVELAVNVHDRTITTVGPVLTEACTVDKGFCPTTRGVLMWDPEMFTPCRLKIGKKSLCLKTSETNTLTCPELSITITDMQLSHVCGINLGSTGTGGYFSSEQAGEVVHGVEGTAAVLRHIIPQLPQGKTTQPTRFKRNVHDKKKTGDTIPDDPGVLTYVEYPLQQKYIISQILKGDKAQFWNLRQSMCRDNMMMIDHVHHQASTGDATGMVQTLTGDKSLRASLHGDFINVWACEEIFSYQFEVRAKDVNCTVEWPMRVMGEDKVTRQAWLRPLNHEVVYEPTPTDCPPPPFYFEGDDDRYVLLDEKKFVDEPDILPNPGASFGDPTDITQIAFNPQQIYTFDELSNKDYEERKQQRLNSAADLIGAVAASAISGKKIPPKEKGYLDEMGLQWGGGYVILLYVVIGILILIGIAVGAIVFAQYQVPIGAFFRNAWANFKFVLRCIFCMGRKEESNGNPTQNQQSINVVLNGIVPTAPPAPTAQQIYPVAQLNGVAEPLDRMPYPTLPRDIENSRINLK